MILLLVLVLVVVLVFVIVVVVVVVKKINVLFSRKHEHVLRTVCHVSQQKEYKNRMTMSPITWHYFLSVILHINF